MQKEFGKWLMDVAKYVATAVILSTIFRDMQEKSVFFVLGILSMVFMLTWGLYLVREPKIKSKKRKK